MEIKKADKKEYLGLRSLWCKIFNDEPDYVDAVYENLDAVGYVAVEDGKVVSCLTLFEVGKFCDKSVDVSYAICTEPDARGKGYASKLIEYVRDEVLGAGKLSLICPAEKSLVSFYQRLQYESVFYASKESSPVSYYDIVNEFSSEANLLGMNERFVAFIGEEYGKELPTVYRPTKAKYHIVGMLAGLSIDVQGDSYLPYFGFPME